MKGKPWSAEREKQLRELVEAKISLKVIAEKFGLSSDAVLKKCERLGLEVVVDGKAVTTTTSIVIPKDFLALKRQRGCWLVL